LDLVQAEFAKVLSLDTKTKKVMEKAMFELTTTRTQKRPIVSVTDNYRRPGTTGRESTVDQLSPSLDEVLGLLNSLEAAA
jgi:hypothetical protein